MSPLFGIAQQERILSVSVSCPTLVGQETAIKGTSIGIQSIDIP